MLQKAFFKVDVVDRIYDSPVFEKTTPGNYSFTVPEEYNYVVIEYAGASGGAAYRSDFETPAPGGGAVLKEKQKIKNRTISGIVASTATNYSNGGTGYNNGANGDSASNSHRGGGGGGSTSININNTIKEASGGAGQWCSVSGGINAPGGKGGGKYGGVSQWVVGDNNATDPGKIGLNSGDGYVKIWAGYDPYL